MIDHIDQIPSNKSILIISSARTGSTALCNLIERKKNIECFYEIFNKQFQKKSQEQFWEYVNSNKLWSCKIFPGLVADYQINQKPVILQCHDRDVDPNTFDILSSNSNVYLLKRRNIAKQMASSYIMYKTDRTHYTKDQTVNEYSVDINDIKMRSIIKWILNTSNQAEKFRNYVEDVIYYEDIKHCFVGLNSVETVNPVNYNEIVYEIEKRLKDY